VRLSDGEFEPNVNETIGGVDMIAWAAAQPWSAGVVGTFGGPYIGAPTGCPLRHAAMKGDLVNGGRQDRCMSDAGEAEAEAVRIWHSQSSSTMASRPTCCRSVSDSDCRRHVLWPRRDHAGDSSAGD
jgi:hypothetical protein